MGIGRIGFPGVVTRGPIFSHLVETGVTRTVKAQAWGQPSWAATEIPCYQSIRSGVAKNTRVLWGGPGDRRSSTRGNRGNVCSMTSPSVPRRVPGSLDQARPIREGPPLNVFRTVRAKRSGITNCASCFASAPERRAIRRSTVRRFTVDLVENTSEPSFAVRRNHGKPKQTYNK